MDLLSDNSSDAVRAGAAFALGIAASNNEPFIIELSERGGDDLIIRLIEASHEGFRLGRENRGFVWMKLIILFEHMTKHDVCLPHGMLLLASATVFQAPHRSMEILQELGGLVGPMDKCRYLEAGPCSACRSCWHGVERVLCML